MKPLLAVGRFSHYAESVLATVYGLALVGGERFRDVYCHICGFVGFELGVTSFADADRWGSVFHDPQFPLWHGLSLAQPCAGAECL